MPRSRILAFSFSVRSFISETLVTKVPLKEWGSGRNHLDAVLDRNPAHGHRLGKVPGAVVYSRQYVAVKVNHVHVLSAGEQ